MDYPSNANMGSVQTNEPPKVDSAITSTPKQKSMSRGGVKNFVFQQDFNDIKEGVIKDIVKPKIQDWVYNVVEDVLSSVSSTIQMMIFGDVKYRTGGSGRVGDRVSYNQFSNKNRTGTIAPTISSSFASDSIQYESRGEAEAVLASMQAHLQMYPVVTVAQMYEFSNLKTPNYTTNNYGWTDLSEARIRRDWDGDYVIDLPRAKPVGR